MPLKNFRNNYDFCESGEFLHMQCNKFRKEKTILSYTFCCKIYKRKFHSSILAMSLIIVYIYIS